MLKNKMLKKLLLLVVVLTLIIGGVNASFAASIMQNEDSSFIEWDVTPTVEKDKVWKIRFSSIIDETTITKDNIYIVNDKGERQDITLEPDENLDTVIIKPPHGGYDSESEYYLYITKNVKNISNKKLKSGIMMRFYIEKEEHFEMEISKDVVPIEESEIFDLTEEKIILNKEKEIPLNKIIILEPSTNYPGGLARKVIGTTIEDGKTVMLVEEPTIDEFIDELNINTSLALDVEEIGEYEILSNNVQSSIYHEYNDETGEYEKGILYNIEETEADFEILSTEISNKIMIHGQVKMIDPKIDFEFIMKKGKESTVKLVFSSKIETKITFEGKFSGKEKEEITIVKYKIPIPNVPGLVIEPKIQAIAEIGGKGKCKVEWKSTYLCEVGAHLSKGELKRINNYNEIKKPQPIVIGENPNLEGKCGLELKIEPKISDVIVTRTKGFAGLGIEGSLETNPMNYTEYEIEYGLKAELKFEPRISKKIEFTFLGVKYKYEIGVGLASIELFNGFIGKTRKISNKEKLIGLKISPSGPIEMKQGENKKIAVIGTFENQSTKEKKEKDITHLATLVSNNPVILSVAQDGSLYSSIQKDQEKRKEKVTVNAKYQEGDISKTAKVDVLVEIGDDSGSDEEEPPIEGPEGYVLAKDSDFEWREDSLYYGSWHYVGNDEYVVIPHVIQGEPVTSYQGMFAETSVKGVVSNNKNVKNMRGMFYYSQATALDLSSFDTSNVINMRYMFYGSQATALDLSSFDTRNVIDMHYMFLESQATALDLSSFDTSNVTDMDGMFYGSQATALDLSSFDTSNVIDMGYMFFYSQALDLDLSSFDTRNVTDMSWMFQGSQATALDLSSFDTSNVTDMGGMFYGSQATALDLSSFDTRNVIDMHYMFLENQATALDLSSFDTSNVTDMGLMFRDSQATVLDLSSFDTSNVTDMGLMFRDSQATVLDLSSFDTSNVIDMDFMFWHSQATIGYARTQADADRFNDSYETKIPDNLKFVVK